MIDPAIEAMVTVLQGAGYHVVRKSRVRDFHGARAICYEPAWMKDDLGYLKHTRRQLAHEIGIALLEQDAFAHKVEERPKELQVVHGMTATVILPRLTAAAHD